MTKRSNMAQRIDRLEVRQAPTPPEDARGGVRSVGAAALKSARPDSS